MWGPQAAGIGLPSPGLHCKNIHSGPCFLPGICAYPTRAWGLPASSLEHSPPAVITELEDIVGVRGRLRAHDGLKQRLCQLLPIQVKLALEEPVSAVLTAEGDGVGEGRVEIWGSFLRPCHVSSLTLTAELQPTHT